ncbi:hypothetical protein GQ53DRAFT_70381 [Thozetella sp. PMI_491]|nr:hypothetical protein GQ53DRAFT_70381 [Thozetella sp. PMI_491]
MASGLCLWPSLGAPWGPFSGPAWVLLGRAGNKQRHATPGKPAATDQCRGGKECCIVRRWWNSRPILAAPVSSGAGRRSKKNQLDAALPCNSTSRPAGAGARLEKAALQPARSSVAVCGSEKGYFDPVCHAAGPFTRFKRVHPLAHAALPPRCLVRLVSLNTFTGTAPPGPLAHGTRHGRRAAVATALRKSRSRVGVPRLPATCLFRRSTT